MITRKVMNASKKECSEWSKEALIHAKSKLRSADVLAENGDFGTAVGISIIAMEESVKALILAFDGLGFRFRENVPSIKSVFENHSLRYVMAFFLSAVLVFKTDFKRFIENFKNGNSRFLDILIDEPDRASRVFYRWLSRKFLAMITELDWFQNVDVYRQKAFYSDFQNHIQTPLHATEKDFEDIRFRTGELVELCDWIIESYTQKDEFTEKALVGLKETIGQDRVYSQLDEWIKSIKHDNKAFFKEAEEFLKGFGGDFPKMVDELYSNDRQNKDSNTGK